MSTEPRAETQPTEPKYRLPDATRPGRVQLQVADLGRAVAYYERTLGLRTRQSEGRTAILTARNGDTPLVELDEMPGVIPVPRRGRLGLYHFALLLPDRPSLGRFIAHLAEAGTYAGMADHDYSEALYLTDPDGLGIEVYADRPRSAWRRQGTEIVGTTEPLDVASLVESARGSSWDGMPAGTVVGHVHFHVGDLVRAEAFYHRGLGFDVVFRGFPGALFVSAGGYHHHVGLNTWAAGAPNAGDREARLLSWELRLPDRAAVDATVGSLAREGFAVNSLAAEDPWGIRVRLTVA